MKTRSLLACCLCLTLSAAVLAPGCASNKEAVRGVSAPGSGGTPTPSSRPEPNPTKGSDNGPP